MKEFLIDKITSWSEEQASAFHNGTLASADEDRKYIWGRRAEGVFLYKDINAVFFCNNGEVHKISKWSYDRYWEWHRYLYDELSDKHACLIEKPQHFEYIQKLDMGYSIVQRPGNEPGYGLIESALSDELTQTDIIENIQSMKILLEALDLINKKHNTPYPFPPKQFINSKFRFWADFKYWKYTRYEFVENYKLSYKRFLPVLTNDYGLKIDINKIKNQLDRL